MSLEYFFRLLEGRPIPDVQANLANLPTDDQKAALVGEGTPSTTNKYATRTYVDGLVDGLDWQGSVQHSIDYVKAGTPIGIAAAENEKCLDTTGFKIHTFTGGAWNAGVALTDKLRFIFKDDGTDVSGDSGTFIHDNKIREYRNGAISEITPTKAAAVNVEDENTPNGNDYVFNGTDWVLKGGTVPHNSLASIQGETTGEYYHLTSDERGAVNSATTPSAANPVMTNLDRDKVASPIKFRYSGGFPISQTDVEVYEAAGSFQRILMPSAGSIVKATLQSTADRTAGTLTAEPTLNGTKAVNDALDMVLDAGTTNNDRAEVAPGTTNLTFAAGDQLGSKMTSDGSWAPVTSDIEITYWVVFNT